MKKIDALMLLGAPPLLAVGWLGAWATLDADQQAPPAGTGYHFESQHFSMEDAGRLLERWGGEIQQSGQITAGEASYPLTGFGGIELSVRARGNGAGVQIGFGSSGRTGPPSAARRQDYDPYQRGGRASDPSAVADLLAEIGQTLAATGTVVLEDHEVAFRGTADIDMRLTQHTGGRRPYALEALVTFGEGNFSRPNDDEDYGEDLGFGLTEEAGRDQQQGANRNTVAEMFASLAQGLRAGSIRVGDGEFGVDETVDFGITHVTAVDGSYDKIEIGLQFGPERQRRAEGARYGDEEYNEPTADLAALLQRIGSQILEDGTFELGGEVFSVGRTSSWEVSANQRGFSVEVSYHEPPN